MLYGLISMSGFSLNDPLVAYVRVIDNLLGMCDVACVAFAPREFYRRDWHGRSSIIFLRLSLTVVCCSTTSCVLILVSSYGINSVYQTQFAVEEVER